MPLPSDVSRCNGMREPKSEVQPGCLDCQRYQATQTDDEKRWFPYMQPPAKMPCMYRIKE